MNLLRCVHHLQAEAVFVQSYALDLFAVRGHDRHRLVALGKFFRWLRKSPCEPLARVPDGLHWRLHGSRDSHRRQVGPDATSFSFHHVTCRTIGISKKQLSPMRSVTELCWGRARLNTGYGRDD